MTRPTDAKAPHGAASSERSLTFFRERFGLDERGLDAALGTALERKVDHADLFFEYTTQDSVVLEEGIDLRLIRYIAGKRDGRSAGLLREQIRILQ